MKAPRTISIVRDLRVRFGGMKASGVGPESFRGEEAFRFFTEPKNICIAKQLILDRQLPMVGHVPKHQDPA